MPNSSSRIPSLQLPRSSVTTVSRTTDSLRAMVAPASDSSVLFFLWNTFLPSFLMTPSFRNQPRQPPAFAATRLIEPGTTTNTPTSPKPTGQRRSSRLSSQSLVLTSLLWSLALVCVVDAQVEPCAKTHPFIGFRGTFSPNVGTIQILDDCTFSHVTSAGFNNASIRQFRWGGQIQDSQGSLQRIGVVSAQVVTGSDLPVAYRLSPGFGWSSFDFLTMQTQAGEIIAAVPLGRPGAITTTTTTTRTTTTTISMGMTTTMTTMNPTTMVPPATTTSPPNGTALPVKTPVPTMTDPASPLVVRIGPNPNYPGLTPTVLNVSLWINDTESPVLLLTRGKRYTFSIQAGTAHPVYITSSKEGGKKSVVNSTEIVVAGNITTFGTISSPFLLDFVAPLKGEIAGINDTTGALFYQCYIHRRMGWKIIFQDNNGTNPDTSDANVVPRGAGHVALVVLVLATVALVL